MGEINRGERSCHSKSAEGQTTVNNNNIKILSIFTNMHYFKLYMSDLPALCNTLVIMDR